MGMGQRVNATALRLFGKNITKSGNLWYTNNKDLYTQYIHDDILISNYLTSIFEAKGFGILDLNIKRLNGKVSINLCLFSLLYRLKNPVSELKFSSYYKDIINLKAYDFEDQFYP